MIEKQEKVNDSTMKKKTTMNQKKNHQLSQNLHTKNY